MGSAATTSDVEKELQEIAAGRTSSADYGIKFGPTGATIPDDLGREQWAETLRRLGSDSARSWHLGDLLAFGDRRYGDGTYALAADALGFKAVGSLRNLASVSRRVAPAQRRAGLSHRTHRTVAAFSVKEQERWLGRAETEGWTSTQLAEAIREPKRPKPEAESRVANTTPEAEVVHEVPTGENADLDHGAHWEAAGMPEYEPQEPPFKVVVICDAEADRDDLMEYLEWPAVHASSGRTTSVHWPDRPLDDVRSVQFQEAAQS